MTENESGKSVQQLPDRQKDDQKRLLELQAAFDESKSKIEALTQRADTLEHKLELAEEHYRAVFNTRAIGLLVQEVEPDGSSGRYLEINDYLCKLFGYSREEALTLRLHQIASPEVLAKLPLIAQKLLRDQHAHFEGDYLTKDGQKIPLEINLDVFFLQGKPYVLSCGRDIRQRRKNQEALQREKEKAETASMAKSNFLANMSHDLRTPLAGIVGMAEILSRTPLDAQQLQYANTILRSAESLTVIINDLLDISRIEQGQVRIESVPFELLAMIQDVIQVFSFHAEAKGLQLVQEAAQDLPQQLVGDSAHIRQVLMNLLDNAIKFTSHGQVKVRALCLSQSETEVRLQIRIEDTGIGVEQDKLAEIFDKFTQADDSIKKQYGGLGLGLAISKRLAELMGGTMGAESKPGHGSAFWFDVTLPRTAPPSAQPPPVKRANIESPIQPWPTSTPPAKVLVVEDNEINQKVVATILRRLGLLVDVAGTGKEALARLEQHPYHLVFMDCQLPDMDGFEVTMTIRRKETKTKQHIPIVAMTAYAMSEDRQRCLEAGMDDYMSKPVTFNDFQQVLSRMGFG